MFIRVPSLIPFTQGSLFHFFFWFFHILFLNSLSLCSCNFLFCSISILFVNIWLQILVFFSILANMSNSERRIISFEEGWDFMQQGIQKLLEGLPEPNITADDYMMLYTYVSILQGIHAFCLFSFSVMINFVFIELIIIHQCCQLQK